MTLTLEQWHEILKAVRSNNNQNGNDILEQIKAKLEEQYLDIYQEWEDKGFGFNIDHLFNVQNDQIDEKYTLLHIAASNGHLDTVKYLVNKEKADVNKANNRGNTALHKAAENGHLDTVKYFVDEKKVDVNIANKYGHTPLHYAAEVDEMDVVKFLLNKGPIHR